MVLELDGDGSGCLSTFPSPIVEAEARKIAVEDPALQEEDTLSFVEIVDDHEGEGDSSLREEEEDDEEAGAGVGQAVRLPIVDSEAVQRPACLLGREHATFQRIERW